MTIDEVKARVLYIASIANDDESAHSTEDELYKDLLECFAKEAPEPFRSFAAAALETKKMDFARWCA